MREIRIRIKGINLGRTGLDHLAKDLEGIIKLHLWERNVQIEKIKILRRY